MPYRHDGSGGMEYFSREPDNGNFVFNITKVKRRLANHRRRAREYGVVSEQITPDDIRAIIEKQNGLCAYSHDPLDSSWEIEHVDEMVNGGSNTLNNLVIVNRHWNRSKGDRSIEYLIDQEEADKVRREHHEEDWEAEDEASHLAYQWNTYYREGNEPEIHIDWLHAYDEHLSMEDFSIGEDTSVDDETILDWVLTRISRS